MKRLSIVMLVGLAAALPAQAQKLAPGLWEYSTTVKGSGEYAAAQARMQAEMARMPPEQRKMMENMMAQRGVTMGGGADGQATVIKTCVTADMASRDEMPQHDNRCRQTSTQRSGSTMKFKFVCSGQPASSGEGEYTFVSDKQMKGRMLITTQVDGKPQTMEMHNSGRWLGADCGSIKPPAMPAKK
jgi:hypothetical protein